MLTGQFRLGGAELMKARAVFKDVRDHGVSKTLRTGAMSGIKMIDDALERLSHLGEQ